MRRQELLDATSLEISSKSKEDFIIGRSLLDVESLTRYSSLPMAIPSCLKILARRSLQRTTSSSAFSPSLPDPETVLRNSLRALPESITRRDYSLAFDPIASSEHLPSTGALDPSVFDRPMNLISVDVAPFVRGIVAYDENLKQERLKMSSLLSEGGRPKKMRKTRSAFSAMEGGPRGTTRRENYFHADLNPKLVLRTGGVAWGGVGGEGRTAESMGAKVEKE
jgi:hypothetical protein